jgi:hypothetical protein
MTADYLRSWIVPVDAVPYVTGTLNRTEFMGVVSVQVVADRTRAIVTFKGRSVYVENQMCKILKDLVIDEGWPSEASVPKEKKPTYY